MRHQRSREKLGLKTAPREALLSRLAVEMGVRGRIETTALKAKVTQRFVEKMITLAKRNHLHARRQLISKLRSVEAADCYMHEVAPSFTTRTSGFTRVTLSKRRVGDGAEMAILEFTDPIKRKEVEKTEKEKKKKPKAKRSLADPAPKKPKATETPEKPATEDTKDVSEKEDSKETPDKEKVKRGGCPRVTHRRSS